MANVNVNFNAWVPAQLVAQRFGPGLNFMTVSAETVPPTVALVSPLTGLLDKFTPVVLDVTDSSGFALINISIELPTGEEVVYRAGAFTVGYRDSSAASSIVGGYRFTLVRKAGWPAGTVLNFNIDPVDAKGNKG